MTFARDLGGCSCINQSAVLSALAAADGRVCQLPNGGGDGILLPTLSCASYDYGSSSCLQHDLLHDASSCNMDEISSAALPTYCFRPWCYVNATTCMRDSEDRVYRSAYFSYESGVDLFYSYSVCNSTAEDWLAVEDELENKAMGDISITAAIPAYILPMLYKRDPNGGEILGQPGDEYYENSIPFEGVYMSYVESIKEISNGDMHKITYTHKSRSSSRVHPTSSFTAAVQDVADGLVDMAIGPFWITGQRLKLTSFTTPVVVDKSYLVIPKPGEEEALKAQVAKVLAPFTNALWGMLLGIVIVAALLAVWFSDKSDGRSASTNAPNRRGDLQNRQPKMKRRRVVYARLMLDSFLQKGTYFFGAGVDHDPSASLPHKFLMFGFGFFILISVSAYVANLAAFLTRSMGDSVTTMEGTVRAGYRICAHPVIENELRTAWPDGNFYFTQTGRDFRGMLEDFDEGRCQVLIIGWEDTSMDTDFLENLCDRGLVYTSQAVVEIPMGFPIRPKLAAGFSFWMYQGAKYHDMTVTSVKDDFAEEIQCNIRLESSFNEADKYKQISVQNMFFPLVFFLACVFIAVVLQLVHHFNVKRGGGSTLVGRVSTLSLFSESRQKSQRRVSFFDSIKKRSNTPGQQAPEFAQEKSDNEPPMGLGEATRLGSPQLNGLGGESKNEMNKMNALDALNGSYEDEEHQGGESFQDNAL